MNKNFKNLKVSNITKQLINSKFCFHSFANYQTLYIGRKESKKVAEL